MGVFILSHGEMWLVWLNFELWRGLGLIAEVVAHVPDWVVILSGSGSIRFYLGGRDGTSWDELPFRVGDSYSRVVFVVEANSFGHRKQDFDRISAKKDQLMTIIALGKSPLVVLSWRG